MRTKDDIESYLLRAELRYENLEDGVWVIQGSETAQVVIALAEPLLVCRVNIMEVRDVPSRDREACFRTLLELNAGELVHGAYGIEDGKIVLSHALELENLDFNEFRSMVEDISLAVEEHHSRLARFRGAAAA